MDVLWPSNQYGEYRRKFKVTATAHKQHKRSGRMWHVRNLATLMVGCEVAGEAHLAASKREYWEAGRAVYLGKLRIMKNKFDH